MTTKTRNAIRSLAAHKAHVTRIENALKRAKGASRKELQESLRELTASRNSFQKANAKALAAT